MTTIKEYKAMIEGATDGPLPCSCGCKPSWGATKITGCQLHGEPVQHLKLSCKNMHCPAKPEIIGGNKFVYGTTGEWIKKGNDKARALTIEIWNEWVGEPYKLTSDLIRVIELAEEALKALPSEKGQSITFEGSPYYLVDPDTIQACEQALSEIKKLKGE